jgi:CRP-like cAMP-binding protein
MRYHQEIKYKTGEVVFTRNTNADAFFVVLKGAVAVSIDSDDPRHNLRSNRQIVSGAGLVTQTGSSSNLLDPLWEESASGSTLVVASVWPPGSVFGYVDCLLERERHFTAVATQPRTTVAKITSSHMQMIQREQSQLDALLQRVLLQQSLLDLANCTCEE